MGDSRVQVYKTTLLTPAQQGTALFRRSRAAHSGASVWGSLKCNEIALYGRGIAASASPQLDTPTPASAPTTSPGGNVAQILARCIYRTRSQAGAAKSATADGNRIKLPLRNQASNRCGVRPARQTSPISGMSAFGASAQRRILQRCAQMRQRLQRHRRTGLEAVAIAVETMKQSLREREQLQPSFTAASAAASALVEAGDVSPAEQLRRYWRRCQLSGPRIPADETAAYGDGHRRT